MIFTSICLGNPEGRAPKPWEAIRALSRRIRVGDCSTDFAILQCQEGVLYINGGAVPNPHHDNPVMIVHTTLELPDSIQLIDLIPRPCFHQN